MSDPVQEALPPLPYRVWNDSDFGDVYTAEQMREYANAAIEQLRAEVDAQARLNGMGSEREARLMAEVARLRGEVDTLKTADWFKAGVDQEAELIAAQERAEKAEAEAAQLRAEKEAAERNERRYLWLRSQESRCDGHVSVNWNIGHDWMAVNGDDLDAAIDHAMHQEQTK